MRGWMMAVALVAAPAMAAEQQFDLICSGSRKAAAHYRVDLARGEWCQAECKGTVKIADATLGTLTLLNRKAVRPRDSESRVTINRSTGEWHSYWSFGDQLPVVEDGVCLPAAFSGFPATRF